MRVLVDQDGVLADFDGGWLEAWRRTHPDRLWIPAEERTTHLITDQYPPAQRRDVLRIYCQEGFYAGLQPVPGAIQAAHQMLELGYDVRICTRPDPRNRWCKEEKRAWVRAWFGPELEGRLIFSRDKTRELGHVLIEDCPEPHGNRRPTWKHVVFDRPYNRQVQGAPRIVGWENWQEILEPLRQEVTR